MPKRRKAAAAAAEAPPAEEPAAEQPAQAKPGGSARKRTRKAAPAPAAAPEAAPAAAAAAPAAAAAGGSGAFWLVKSEPDEFSIEQLKGRPHQTEGWEGVRNAQARNNLRAMKLGDRAFFYHSSCKVPGIVGIVEVVREAYPDATATDRSSRYHDAKASADDPRWFMVDFKLVRELRRQITLTELKSHAGGGLEGMALFNRPRLSVQPVTSAHWDFIMALEDKEGGE